MENKLCIMLLYFLLDIFFMQRVEGYMAGYSPTVQPSLCVHDDTFVPDQILRVVEKEIPYDCIKRLSPVINGTFPGPTLRFKEGDAVWIRVYNDMSSENLTIHWHGLTQRTSPFSDGTPMISQWPIPPGHYFDYEFKLFPGDAGTYFYHTHIGVGIITATAPLIVDEAPPKKPPYQYDDEIIIHFTESYHQTDAEIMDGLEAERFHASFPTATIVNGHSVAHGHPAFGPLTAIPDVTFDQFDRNSCAMALFTLKPGLTYRIRFIGSTAIGYVFAALESHNWTLIEIDAGYTAPLDVDHVEVAPGMRFSVLMKAKSAAEVEADRAKGKNFYYMQLQSKATVVNSFSVFTYDGYQPTNRELWDYPKPEPFPPFNPLTNSSTWFNDVWTAGAQPLYIDDVLDMPTLQEVTRTIYVNVQEIYIPPETPSVSTTIAPGFNDPAIGDAIIFWQNGYPWFETMSSLQEPYLVSIYKNHTDNIPNYDTSVANGGFDVKTRTWPVKIGEVIEIVWQLVGNNNSAAIGDFGAEGRVEDHPMHAHGNHYYDVGFGPGPYDQVATDKANAGKIFVKRDTTNVYRPNNYLDPNLTIGDVYSHRAWRLRVQNPGVWMMHCHIVQHMIMGMNTVWVFGELGDLTPVPKELIEGYLNYGGAAYGNASYAPRVLHFWHDPI